MNYYTNKLTEHDNYIKGMVGGFFEASCCSYWANFSSDVMNI